MQETSVNTDLLQSRRQEKKAPSEVRTPRLSGLGQQDGRGWVSAGPEERVRGTGVEELRSDLEGIEIDGLRGVESVETLVSVLAVTAHGVHGGYD